MTPLAIQFTELSGPDRGQCTAIVKPKKTAARDAPYVTPLFAHFRHQIIL
jgi:hypothetical protein